MKEEKTVFQKTKELAAMFNFDLATEEDLKEVMFTLSSKVGMALNEGRIQTTDQEAETELLLLIAAVKEHVSWRHHALPRIHHPTKQ